MAKIIKRQKSNILFMIFYPFFSQKMVKTGISDFSKNILLPEKKMKITAMISAHWRIIISKKIASAR